MTSPCNTFKKCLKNDEDFSKTHSSCILLGGTKLSSTTKYWEVWMNSSREKGKKNPKKSENFTHFLRNNIYCRQSGCVTLSKNKKLGWSLRYLKADYGNFLKTDETTDEGEYYQVLRTPSRHGGIQNSQFSKHYRTDYKRTTCKGNY